MEGEQRGRNLTSAVTKGEERFQQPRCGPYSGAVWLVRIGWILMTLQEGQGLESGYVGRGERRAEDDTKTVSLRMGRRRGTVNSDREDR